MSQVIEINQRKFFTLAEARQILPVIKRITKQSQDEVHLLSTQLSYAKDKSRKKSIEQSIHETIDDWALKIKKLGADVKGMWLVDFDTGEGYFCWKFPEDDIEHFHTYVGGFGSRIRLN